MIMLGSNRTRRDTGTGTTMLIQYSMEIKFGG